MIETTGKEIIKEILRLIKDKAFIATLIYIICAVLSLLSLFAIILPFSVNMSFMDNVTWKNSLGAGQPLLHTTFALCLINTVVCIARRAIMINLYNSSNQSFRRICGALYTIEDMVTGGLAELKVDILNRITALFGISGPASGSCSGTAGAAGAVLSLIFLPQSGQKLRAGPV